MLFAVRQIWLCFAFRVLCFLFIALCNWCVSRLLPLPRSGARRCSRRGRHLPVSQWTETSSLPTPQSAQLGSAMEGFLCVFHRLDNTWQDSPPTSRPSEPAPQPTHQSARLFFPDKYESAIHKFVLFFIFYKSSHRMRKHTQHRLLITYTIQWKQVPSLVT